LPGLTSQSRLGQPRNLFDNLICILPGVALCIAVTLAAVLLQVLEGWLTGHLYLEALVLAILLGVGIRTAWIPGPRWTPGIQFSAKTILEVAIVLLGASVSAVAVAELGSVLLAGIASVVVIAVLASYVICRAFGLSQRMSILVACGNSICGNSAIAAVAPIIGADGDDVASSIAFTAVLGVVVVLGLPLLVSPLDMTLTQYGVFAGLTVYAVPQVLAATLPIGALSNQIGTVVKLVRVLMLGPVLIVISLFASRLRLASNGSACRSTAADHGRKRYMLREIVPWFIVGFVVVAVVRSLGLLSGGTVALLTTMSTVLTTVSMAALGLGVDVRVVAGAGVRLTAAVTASLLVLGLISFVLIHLARIA
jgi:uncharacterized integral membrane protein (TIGR00698 family)